MLTTHSKTLEAQIAQKDSFSSTLPNRFSSKPEPSHREQCNVMILRGGQQLEEPKGVTHNESFHGKNEDIENVEESTPSKELIDNVVHKSDKVPKDLKITSPKPYTSPLLFPQRMAKAKLDLQFGKFLEVLKKLYINIPFTEALTQMPSYAKFLKEILSNKRKLEEHETITLTEECSAEL